jgi:hypothetical protein
MYPYISESNFDPSNKIILSKGYKVTPNMPLEAQRGGEKYSYNHE